MHVSKKHSNKTNNKHAYQTQNNNMHVTFGKQTTSNTSNNTSNYTSVKSQKLSK